MSCLEYSLSMVTPTIPSIQLPVLLSLNAGEFRLQGFMLELVTCQPSAFLPFSSVVRLNHRIVFARNKKTIKNKLVCILSHHMHLILKGHAALSFSFIYPLVYYD